MARVFFWRPSIDLETKTPLVGHLSMELNKDRTYISCWPKTDSKLKNLFGNELTTQTLEQDKHSEKRQYDDYIAIPEEFIDHDKLVNWWYKKRPKEYTLHDYNCARCVYDALQAGGFEVFRSATNAFSPLNLRHPDDDDPSPEEIKEWRDNPIEDKPILPETAFEWIKKAVKEQIDKKSEAKDKKCTIS